MKKTYMQPEMKVVRIKKQHLLAGSPLGMYGKDATGEAMSREFDDDDIDF